MANKTKPEIPIFSYSEESFDNSYVYIYDELGASTPHA